MLGSRDSVTADLCGTLAVLVDPYDVEALAAGLLTLIEDDALQRRAACEGPTLARQYTPLRSANAWQALLAEAVRERGP